jgi:HK97 gp10 family phage protein
MADYSTIKGGGVATFSVDGLRELGESMKKLDLAVRFKISERALRAGAAVIQRNAKKLAPQSDEPHQWGVRKGVKVDPGNLKKNVFTVRIKNTNLTSEVEVRVRRTKKPPKDAFYWLFLEFGTVKMAPRPFIRPAFQQSREQAANRIAERLKKEIFNANTGGPKPRTKSRRG